MLAAPTTSAMPPPAVSVVIPTRDRRSHLPVTLRAALDQKDVDHEVIVVDDGSCDGTAETLAELHHPRLLVLRNPAPCGVAAARNRGIAAARAPWIAFLDDDDLWSPHMLATQLAAVRGRPAVLCYCDTVILDEQLDAIGQIVPPEPEEIVSLLLSWNYIGGPSVVMAEAEALRRVGGFDEQLSVLADWDLWIRLAGEGPLVHCPASLVGYVIHADGMFSRLPAAVTADFRAVAAKHHDRTAALGLRPDTQRLALALAYGHARADRRLRAAGEALGAAARHRDPKAVALGLSLLVGYRFALRVRRWGMHRGSPGPPAWLEAEVGRKRAVGSMTAVPPRVTV